MGIQRGGSILEANSYSWFDSSLEGVLPSVEGKEALADQTARRLLELGYLRFEKCELREAQDCFEQALELAKKQNNSFYMGEALVGLLRLAGESLDDQAIDHWNAEIDQLAEKAPQELTSRVDYCRGVILMIKEEWIPAQRQFHRYLRRVRKSSPKGAEIRDLYSVARALCMLANCFQQRGHFLRSQQLLDFSFKHLGSKNIRSINGILALIQGNLFERQEDFIAAHEWYQRAHASFLAEHNWYFYLYVLYGYARLARHQENYKKAYFYIDLIEKATSSQEFGVLKRELKLERQRLEKDVVDLLIDYKRGVVKTRASGAISFRKQYVLLDILKELSRAHTSPILDPDRSDGNGGLSKGEIIEKVWSQSYRPEVHDNKLYYNINRLRKLIEPNCKRPRYLLNWKEGYRLAPGLRIQFVDLGFETDRESDITRRKSE